MGPHIKTLINISINYADFSDHDVHLIPPHRGFNSGFLGNFKAKYGPTEFNQNNAHLK